jgi:ElaB/YqjD/DUF883 family membrane-anchored ribosome-binding protein
LKSTFGEVVAAFREVSDHMGRVSEQKLEKAQMEVNEARANADRAVAEARAAERQTHNWLWKIFH